METDTCTFGTYLPASFMEHNSKNVQDISTKFVTHILSKKPRCAL